MTLSQDELTEALHDGLKAAEKCSNTFCRAGATIDDGHYLIHHNGIGATTTDAQVVHDTAMLGMNKEQLAERIKTWVAGLHTGVRLDLNAMLATGGRWVTDDIDAHHFLMGIGGETARVCRITCSGHGAMRGPAVLGWPWRGDHFGHVEGGA